MKGVDLKALKVVGAVTLAKTPTLLAIEADSEEVKASLRKVQKKLSKLQDVMYAHNKYGVLICLQGMDTAGKDSLIREVFKEFNPRGVVVSSFKTPSEVELEHDYLWRHYVALPEKGKFAIFNRTQYENVLVSRVHPEYVLKERLPHIETLEDITDGFWRDRLDQINNFEKHIAQNGTIVLKFFLHLSKEEQRERLLRRLEKGKHNWKFSPGDLKEREYWDEYQKYYEEAINDTSKEHAPWYVIPADDKEMARYLIAKTIWDELKTYTDIKVPKLEDSVAKNILAYKKKLAED